MTVIWGGLATGGTDRMDAGRSKRHWPAANF